MRVALLAQCAALTVPQVRAHHVATICKGWDRHTPGYRRSLHCYLRSLLRQLGAPAECHAGFPILKPVRPRETTVPDTEYELAMRHAGPMLQLALMLAREAGLRRGTICRFSRSNCNFERSEVFGRSKAYSSYTVPMTARLRERLLWACSFAVDADEPLLAQYNRNRRPPHYNSLDTELMRLRRRVPGLNHWGLHDLRRTAARALYSRCHDLRKVQSFLGHAAPQQTLWYLGNAGGQLTIEDLEDRLG